MSVGVLTLRWRRALFKRKVRIEKLLDGSGGCLVEFFRTAQQAEVRTELVVQGLCIVTDDIKAAAPGGALWSEGADDDVASGFDRMGDLADVGGAVGRGGEEVKDGAVVPDVVVGGLELDSGDVRCHPMDKLCGFSQASPVRIDCGL